MVQYPKVRCSGHKSTPLVPILSQMIPLHTLQSLVIKIQFNVFLLSCRQLQKELWTSEGCLATIRSGYSKITGRKCCYIFLVVNKDLRVIRNAFSQCTSDFAGFMQKSRFVQGFWVNLTDLREVPRLLNRISYSFLNCLTSPKAHS